MSHPRKASAQTSPSLSSQPTSAHAAPTQVPRKRPMDVVLLAPTVVAMTIM